MSEPGPTPEPELPAVPPRVVPGRARRWLNGAFAALALGGLQWLGDLVVASTGWPVSGSLIGMVLLLVALGVRGSVPAGVEAISAPLLRHLMLLLIPSVAAVSVHAGLLARHGVVFLLVCAGATVATVLVTALVLQRGISRVR